MYTTDLLKFFYLFTFKKLLLPWCLSFVLLFVSPIYLYGQPNAAQKTNKEQTFFKKKPLQTIIVDKYYPYTFVNEHRKPDGFSIDLIKAVTKVMDLKLEIHVGIWDKALDSLKNGKIDLLPMMAYSKVRDKYFDFSVPHTIAFDSFFTRKDTKEIKSINDIHNKTIIVMENDQAHDYLKSVDLISPDQLILIESVSKALRMLSSGIGDAALMPKLVGLVAMKRMNLANLEMSPIVIEEYKRPFSFAVKEGNQFLLERLNQGLKIVKETGQYQTIYKKWFGAYEPPGISIVKIIKYGIGGVTFFILIYIILILWSISLKKMVARRTRRLEKEIGIRKKAQTDLNKAHDELELRVKQRTKELAESNNSLLHEIEERKLAEKKKIKAQKIASDQKKLALIGQVAGKMAHDFNNILSIIMGRTEISLLDCNDAEIKKTLELIFEQTLRGKNLTKNLVAFAKSQEPKQIFFRINEKIDFVLALMEKDLEGITLIKDNEYNVPDLLADPGMIEHALVNFVQNSIHAVSLVKEPTIIVRSYCKNNNICFEIEDNGCGIPKDSLNNIYEPSFTLKGSKDATGSYKPGIKGTGYGMSNIKKYIKQHRGNIFVDSKVGSGTRFTVSLPIIKRELTPEEKKEIHEETEHFGKHILLVEDELSLCDIQFRILTQKPCEHRVDIANNGQVAMDLFDRNKYDFVSLDYILPGGINGMDIYNHIRETNKTIPILFVSGNIEFLESIKELKQQDVHIDHVSKPCQNKDYVSSINSLLERVLAIQKPTP